MSSVVRVLPALALALFAAACSDGTGPGSDIADRRVRAGGGAVIEASKTATGFNESRTEYDWTLSKRVQKILVGEQMSLHPSTTEFHLKANETVWIYYELTATRTALPVQLVSGVRGTVCVSNRGSEATKSLAITDVVQRASAGAFADVATSPVDVSAQPSIGAGETACYPYEVTFAAEAGATYRNTARVTISNESGRVGSTFDAVAGEQVVTAPFTIPTTATPSVVDAEAVVDDGMRADFRARWWERGPCAETYYMFQCSSSDDMGTWRLTGTSSVVFIADYHNRAACGETVRLTNVATLTEGSTPGTVRDVRTDSATVTVTTDPCAQTGCTLTQGYWKQLHHLWPGNTQWERENLRHWPFFDSGRSWQETFDASAAGGDAYLILAHQFMAATLNMANGADAPAEVRETRAAAARYFASTPAVRATYDRATLLAWADLLDRFNNGQLGVPHCG